MLGYGSFLPCPCTRPGVTKAKVKANIRRAPTVNRFRFIVPPKQTCPLSSSVLTRNTGEPVTRSPNGIALRDCEHLPWPLKGCVTSHCLPQTERYLSRR